MGRASSQTLFLPPSALLGPHLDWIRVTLEWCYPIGAAYTLPGLWYHFGWLLAKGILEEVGSWENMGDRVCDISKVSTSLLQEGAYSCP